MLWIYILYIYIRLRHRFDASSDGRRLAAYMNKQNVGGQILLSNDGPKLKILQNVNNKIK